MIRAKAVEWIAQIRNGRSIYLVGVLGYIVAALLLMNWLSQPGLRDAVWFPLVSALAFAAFLGSLLVIYYAPLSGALKALLGLAILLVLLPLLGVRNTFLLEVATQVGIFAAMALGLNIVVGFAGLLDLGYVAFYAVGAYLWAIFGSPQANIAFGTNRFPLEPEWFFLFLFLAVGVAALTGILLGLPVLRLRGGLPRHRHARLRRGDPRDREQPGQADQPDQRPAGDPPRAAAAPLLQAVVARPGDPPG